MRRQLELPHTTAPPELVVYCFRDQGRLRVRVLTAGFEDLFCRFPHKLREVGARFAVRNLSRVVGAHGRPYYAVAGPIRRLEDQR